MEERPGQQDAPQQLEAGLQHVVSASFRDATPSYIFPAPGALCAAGRIGLALHSSGDSRFQLVSCIMQLLMRTGGAAERSNTAPVLTKPKCRRHRALLAEAAAAAQPAAAARDHSPLLPATARRRPRTTFAAAQLADIIQASHAAPVPDPATVAADPVFTLPRKAGPPPILHASHSSVQHQPTLCELQTSGVFSNLQASMGGGHRRRTS